MSSLYGKLCIFAFAAWAGHNGGVTAGLAVCGVMLSVTSAACCERPNPSAPFWSPCKRPVAAYLSVIPYFPTFMHGKHCTRVGACYMEWGHPYPLVPALAVCIPGMQYFWHVRGAKFGGRFAVYSVCACSPIICCFVVTTERCRCKVLSGVGVTGRGCSTDGGLQDGVDDAVQPALHVPGAGHRFRARLCCRARDLPPLLQGL